MDVIREWRSTSKTVATNARIILVLGCLNRPICARFTSRDAQRTAEKTIGGTIQEQRNHAYTVLFVRVTLSRDTRDYVYDRVGSIKK